MQPRPLLVYALALFMTFLVCSSPPTDPPSRFPRFQPEVIEVGFADSISRSSAEGRLRALRLRVDALEFDRLFAVWVQVTQGGVEDAVARLERGPNVLWAQHRGRGGGGRFVLVQFSVRAEPESSRRWIESLPGLVPVEVLRSAGRARVRVPARREGSWTTRLRAQPGVRYAERVVNPAWASELVPIPANVLGVTGPEALVPGESLELVVHWIALSSCPQFSRFESRWSDDTLLTIEPIVVQPRQVGCATLTSIREERFRLLEPPSRSFRVRVDGGPLPLHLKVPRATAADSIVLHRVVVLDRTTGESNPGVRVRWLESAGFREFGAETTATGRPAELRMPCEAATPPFEVDVAGTCGRLRFAESPLRCGRRVRTLIVP